MKTLINTGKFGVVVVDGASDCWYDKAQIECYFVCGAVFDKGRFLLGVFMSGYAYFHYDRMTIFEVEAHSE